MMRLNAKLFTAAHQDAYDNVMQLLQAHLRKQFISQTGKLNDEQLVQHIKQWIEEGQSYGLRSRYDLRRYVEFAATYGPDWKDKPRFAPALRFLTNTRQHPTYRMDQLDEWEEFTLLELLQE